MFKPQRRGGLFRSGVGGFGRPACRDQTRESV